MSKENKRAGDKLIGREEHCKQGWADKGDAEQVSREHKLWRNTEEERQILETRQKTPEGWADKGDAEPVWRECKLWRNTEEERQILETRQKTPHNHRNNGTIS